MMGVKETSNETWEKSEELFKTFKLNLGIKKNIILLKSHGSKSSPKGKMSKPRTILSKFHIL